MLCNWNKKSLKKNSTFSLIVLVSSVLFFLKEKYFKAACMVCINSLKTFMIRFISCVLGPPV